MDFNGNLPTCYGKTPLKGINPLKRGLPQNSIIAVIRCITDAQKCFLFSYLGTPVFEERGWADCRCKPIIALYSPHYRHCE